ncbi:NB-ARC domain-containing disease resistance protein [Euphorbia peplus]|nr:NB-ARC domain-containing disease resistance protein [Euphorbia peplus]
MALEIVAGSLLSALFDYLFQKMESPELLDFFRGHDLDEELLIKLKITMNTVAGLLDEAEEKQISVPAIKRWLDNLKHAAYQADDLFDDIAYEDHRSKIHGGGPASSLNRTVRDAIRVCYFRNGFVRDVNRKLGEIHDVIEHLLKQMQSLGLTLRKGIGEKLASQATTSLPEVNYDSDIRFSDKEAIVKRLLLDGKGISGVCVAGQGGIGKTTIARQVYNDTRVDYTFDRKAWVYVSQEFDVFKITNDIVIQVCCPPSPLNLNSIQMLQNKLCEELKGKKFLLVLDDVWGVKDAEWDDLLKPFKSGDKGNRLVITSRNQNVVSAKHGVQNYVHLDKLDDGDRWKLLKQYAFPDGNQTVDPGFEAFGAEIAKKCVGLPLAVKMMGSLLRCKSSVAEWKSISRSNVWNYVGDDILPVLKLSYQFLPSHVKQCFAYCAIFPKGFAFTKELLINLWMGEGFLLQSKRKGSMEEFGGQCFDSLVSMSFFDPGNEASFTMHDMVRDLSKSVCGDFGFSIGDDDSGKIPVKARHLFVKRERVQDAGNSINQVQFLRSFLLADCGVRPSHHDGKDTLDLLRNLKSLRVLHLEKQWGMYKMPNFIGNLNHLRYLSLRGASITSLPESICRLYYLQILILWDCKKLIELPENLRKLINLFCLDIRRTGLRDMPPRLDELAELQTLSTFILGKNGRSRIKELGKLQNLKGELTIEIRQDFVSNGDSCSCPKLLNKLEFKWDGESRELDQENQLKGLLPHKDLKNLSIIGYKGAQFPDWLTGLSNVVCLKLSQCKKSKSLPPLGQLASLEDLSIIGFDSVVSIASEFYGTNQQKAFQSLRVLRFDKMPSWQIWETKAGAFSKLEKLYIEECPELEQALPSDLPCLSKLDIQQCEQLVLKLPRVSDSCDMELSDRSRRMKLVKKSACWQYLSIRNSEDFLIKILKQIHGVSTASMEIEFGNCDSLRFPLESFPKIKTLRIRDCQQLQSFSATAGSALIFPCKDIHVVDCAELSLPPLLRTQAIETIMVEDSTFMLRFVRLPSGFFCLQISFSTDPAALKKKLKGGYSLTVQEIEIRKNVKHLNLLKWFPKVTSFKVVDSCKSPKYPLSVMEMANPGDSAYLNSWEIVSHSDVAIFPKGIQPAKNLTSLTLRNCDKLKLLPDWMNHLFPSLVNLEIVKCKELLSFPKGSLPSQLKMLHVKECSKLPSLAISTYNSVLATLKLENLQKLQFLHYEVLNSLINLEMSDCPELHSLPEGISNRLPSLKHMKVSICSKLKSSFLKGGFPSTFESLDIQYCKEITGQTMHCDFRKLPNFLKLAVDGFQKVELLPEEKLFPSTLTSLTLLRLERLTSLQLKGLQHLTQLRITHCPMLRNVPECMQDLPSLCILAIYDCPQLESFLKGGLPSRLQELYIWDCDKVVAGLLQYNLRILPSLSLLKIGGYNHVESLSEETLLPPTLTSLELLQLGKLNTLKLEHLILLRHLIIQDCPQLSSLPDKLLNSSFTRISGCPLLQMKKRMASLRSIKSARYNANTP